MLTVDSVDIIEPQLVVFVRGTARWLDPTFPPHGRRGLNERAQWTDDAEIETKMQRVTEFDMYQRGVEIIRLYRTDPPEGPCPGSIRVIAAGLPEGCVLELRWEFVASEHDVRGTSAELTVGGLNHGECLTDFRRWFG